jgi:hypothetical protein
MPAEGNASERTSRLGEQRFEAFEPPLERLGRLGGRRRERTPFVARSMPGDEDHDQ